MLIDVSNPHTSKASQLILYLDSNNKQANSACHWVRFQGKQGCAFKYTGTSITTIIQETNLLLLVLAMVLSVQADYRQIVVPPDHQILLSTFLRYIHHCCHWQSCPSWCCTKKLTMQSFRYQSVWCNIYDSHLMRLSNFKNKQSQEVSKTLGFWILFCSHFFRLLGRKLRGGSEGWHWF